MNGHSTSSTRGRQVKESVEGRKICYVRVQARQLAEKVAGLRQRREGLSEAMQAVTRLRAAQEASADLTEQVLLLLYPAGFQY